MLGEIRWRPDGRGELRFVRLFSEPSEKVWQALTEPGDWFPAIVEFDLSFGNQIRFTPTSELCRTAALPANHAIYGQITKHYPTRLLEYTWGEDLLRWSLTGDHDCRLTFILEFDDHDSAVCLGAGWHACLEALRDHVEGRQADEPVWELAKRLAARYAAVT